MANEPTPKLSEMPAFFRFLMQALTLGKEKVTNNQFPTFVGFLTYAAVVSLLIGSIAFGTSDRAIVGSVIIFALLGALGVLMLLWKVLHPAVLNFLAIVIVLALLLLVIGVTWTLAQSIQAETQSKQASASEFTVRGNVFGADGQPIEDRAFISIPGYPGTYRTRENGQFDFPAPRSALLPDGRLRLMIRVDGLTVEDTVDPQGQLRVEVPATTSPVDPESARTETIQKQGSDITHRPEPSSVSSEEHPQGPRTPPAPSRIGQELPANASVGAMGQVAVELVGCEPVSMGALIRIYRVECSLRMNNTSPDELTLQMDVQRARLIDNAGSQYLGYKAYLAGRIVSGLSIETTLASSVVTEARVGFSPPRTVTTAQLVEFNATVGQQPYIVRFRDVPVKRFDPSEGFKSEMP